MERPRDSKRDIRALAEALAAAQSPAALRAALAQTELDKLAANDAGVLSRALRAWGAPPDLKITYLRSSRSPSERMAHGFFSLATPSASGFLTVHPPPTPTPPRPGRGRPARASGGALR